MNNCDCKHVNICKNDPEKCKIKNDPWIKTDGKILGRSTKEISEMQGRKGGDLK